MKLDLNPILRFMKTLPKSRDVEMTLLKSHLLVEEALTEIICNASTSPKFVKEAKLSFSQKIKMARAVNEIKHSIWVWKGITFLNQARNELAHNLTKEEVEQKVDVFVEYMKFNSTEWPNAEIRGKFTDFHWAVYMAYCILASAVNLDATKIQYNSLLSG